MNPKNETWLNWFVEYYGDSTTGDNANPKDDMMFAQNKILCAIADSLENIIKILELKEGLIRN